MRRINLATFQIAHRGTSREINRQIAPNRVREKQPLSRADLARLMGMRRGPVSRLVRELIEAGLVFEGAKGESPNGGRRPTHHYNTDLMLTHTGGGARPRKLATRMAGSRLQFMKTGDPNGGGLPPWPKYTTAKGETMVLDDVSVVWNDPFGEARRALPPL